MPVAIEISKNICAICLSYFNVEFIAKPRKLNGDPLSIFTFFNLRTG